MQNERPKTLSRSRSWEFAVICMQMSMRFSPVVKYYVIHSFRQVG